MTYSAILKIRVAPEELEQLKQHADKPVSTWAREVLLNELKQNASDDHFEELWVRYPVRNGVRQGKKAALRHYKASVKTDKDREDINSALTNYINSDTVSEGYIQNGSTWFNNWKDYVSIQNNKTNINPVKFFVRD